MPRTKTTWPKGTPAQPPKRGPTGKHAQKDPKSYIPPSDESTKVYIERYACGDSLSHMAKEVGVTVESLRKRFLRYCLSGKADKDYADLVTDTLVAKIADADEMMYSASSMAEITRAEKFMRYTRMDFERRRPHLYGQRAEITFTGPAAIFLGLDVLPQLTQAAAQTDLQAQPIIPNPLMIIEHEPEPDNGNAT